MFPLSSVIKDAFDKFEHDFQAANLPEGKYIKPPSSTAKWYKVGQPCYEEKMQESQRPIQRGLTAYTYPPTALLHRVIQTIMQCHCLIIVKPQAGFGT